MDRYEIVRHYRDERAARVIARGLTLEEAQAHCRHPSTRGEDDNGNVVWFDGYEHEPDRVAADTDDAVLVIMNDESAYRFAMAAAEQALEDVPTDAMRLETLAGRLPSIANDVDWAPLMGFRHADWTMVARLVLADAREILAYDEAR